MRIELASLEGGKGEFAHAYGPDELDLQDEWVRLLVPPVVSGSNSQGWSPGQSQR